MAENAEPLEAEDEEGAEDGKRQRSSIGFPYTDYENAAAVATTIYSSVGTGSCTSGQLAAWMNQSAKSSGFRTQLAAARLFGLIDSDGPDSLRLTPLGRRIVDPAQLRSARVEAFLQVPLFNRLYELHKDANTPPPAALEREIVGLGVAEKQKARARQVFESSAQQTGFRESGVNRLVMPAVIVKPKDEVPPKNEGGGGDGGEGLELDPLLMALLRKIPKAPAVWPADARVRWFRTFAMNVSQVYDDDNDPVELEIKWKEPPHN